MVNTDYLTRVVMKVFSPSYHARAFPFIEQRGFWPLAPFFPKVRRSVAIWTIIKTRGSALRFPRSGPRPAEAVPKLLSHCSQPTSFLTMSSAVWSIARANIGSTRVFGNAGSHSGFLFVPRVLLDFSRMGFYKFFPYLVRLSHLSVRRGNRVSLGHPHRRAHQSQIDQHLAVSGL